ncbi:hypothetical protein RRSWK_03405 [Rhodopirellula sp. SWK7]|nr:hypothetical protein RRSWK_03405 [Rhodopirellula sp. SWK7]
MPKLKTRYKYLLTLVRQRRISLDQPRLVCGVIAITTPSPQSNIQDRRSVLPDR